jgi:hypothetical protein
VVDERPHNDGVSAKYSHLQFLTLTAKS